MRFARNFPLDWSLAFDQSLGPSRSSVCWYIFYGSMPMCITRAEFCARFPFLNFVTKKSVSHSFVLTHKLLDKNLQLLVLKVIKNDKIFKNCYPK